MKQRGRPRAAPAVLAFPLGKTGGLIEAPCPTNNRNWQYEFPLGKTGGLIEAHDSANPIVGNVAGFPLGKTGGLIEAATSRAQPARGTCFRWVKPAASLKPCPRVYTVRPTLCFRWVKPAASLKLGEPVGVAQRVPGFRWVKPAASLKHIWTGRAESQRAVVSAG